MQLQKQPEDVVVVSLMPCTAKKFEAARPEMTSPGGGRHVDFVLTTRELGRMLRWVSCECSSLRQPRIAAIVVVRPASTAIRIFIGVIGASARTCERCPFALLELRCRSLSFGAAGACTAPGRAQVC
jgi:iron only hydrogenase large subunit-like protein